MQNQKSHALSIGLIDLVFSGILIGCLHHYPNADFGAYMQQIYIIFVDRVFDYHWVIADAGPIMYPAGHAYLYWLIEKLTIGGNTFFCACLMALMHAF
jgi:hypothetical protein